MRILICGIALLCAAATTNPCLSQHRQPASPLLKSTARPQAWSMMNRQIAAHTTGAAQLKTTNSSWLRHVTTYFSDDISSGNWIDSAAYQWSGERTMPHYKRPYDLYLQGGFAIGTPTHEQDYNLFPFLKPAYGTHHGADSVDTYLRQNPDSIFISSTQRYAYNTDNNVTDADYWYRNYDTVTNTRYTDISYNAAGKVTQVLYYTDTAGNPGNVFLAGAAYSFYDGNGWLAQDSVTNLVIPGHYQRYNYFKDAQGRDTMYTAMVKDSANAAERPEYYRRHYYNTDGLMERSEYYRYYAAPDSFWLNGLDSFAYDGTNSFPVFYGYYQTASVGLFGGSEAWYTLNAAGDVDHSLERHYNVLNGNWEDTGLVIQYYYNTDGNPDSMQVDEILHNQHWTTYFNYSTEPNNIKAVVKQSVSVSIYPNPARSSVTLSIPSFKPTTRGTASIYDMQGRLVQSCGIIKAEQSIDVSRLPAGMYLVQYSGGDGSVGSARFVKE